MTDKDYKFEFNFEKGDLKEFHSVAEKLLCGLFPEAAKRSLLEVEDIARSFSDDLYVFFDLSVCHQEVAYCVQRYVKQSTINLSSGMQSDYSPQFIESNNRLISEALDESPYLEQLVRDYGLLDLIGEVNSYSCDRRNDDITKVQDYRLLALILMLLVRSHKPIKKGYDFTLPSEERDRAAKKPDNDLSVLKKLLKKHPAHNRMPDDTKAKVIQKKSLELFKLLNGRTDDKILLLKLAGLTEVTRESLEPVARPRRADKNAEVRIFCQSLTLYFILNEFDMLYTAKMNLSADSFDDIFTRIKNKICTAIKRLLFIFVMDTAQAYSEASDSLLDRIEENFDKAAQPILNRLTLDLHKRLSPKSAFEISQTKNTPLLHQTKIGLSINTLTQIGQFDEWYATEIKEQFYRLICES